VPRGVYIKTEEHKRKLSMVLKGRPGYMLGKHHSEEIKHKIGRANSIARNINNNNL